jgi:hypothetical protein
MNVVLHNFPGDGKLKRMHYIIGFQFKIIVPVITQTKEVFVQQDLVFQFVYHDGTHYHYALIEPEFV